MPSSFKLLSALTAIGAVVTMGLSACLAELRPAAEAREVSRVERILSAGQ